MAYTCVVSHGHKESGKKPGKHETKAKVDNVEVNPACSDPKRYMGRLHCLTHAVTFAGGSPMGFRDMLTHTASGNHNIVLRCPEHAEFEAL